MKKIIKKSFALAILATLPISYTTNVHAHRGGGGWGWGGLGLGLGTGLIIGSAVGRGGGGGYRYAGFPNWNVYNNTGFPILVRGSGTGKENFIQIEPGQTAGVPRRKSYKLYAKHIEDPNRRPSYSTMRSPYVEITATPNNRLEFRVSPPPPQPGPPPASNGYYSGGNY